MLSELCATNLGVIEQIRVDFGPGLTALTGETGAGKTLVVDAIKLLTGSRSDSSVVRHGTESARVEGRFHLPNGEELVLAREVPASGRSRSWTNGQMATASSLSADADGLIDLQGQHDHMTLLTADGQRDALDWYCKTDLSSLESARSEIAGIESAMRSMGGDPDERLREIDFLTYQIAELEKVGIGNLDEESNLQEEEESLAQANSNRQSAIQALLAIGFGELDGIDPASMKLSAIEAVSSALTFVSGHAPFRETEARLRNIGEELADIGRDLRLAMEDVREDPERLAEVRARRQLLFEVARKYGGTLQDARNYLDSARERLALIKSFDDEARQLEARRHEASEAFAAACRQVRSVRSQGAPMLAKAVESQLARLAMPKAQLDIQVGDDGAGDRVEFLLSSNPGEPPLPLGKVASGGELARTALAIRLVAGGGPSTLVFDEVDAGLGGEAALTVGRALADLANNHQVIVITHLAQVAAFADHHLAVSKATQSGRTRTLVTPVDGDDRVTELSRMLSGHPDSDAARNHARELLAQGIGRSTK
ncbi:MAG TPA: DNA repair protein RecN [Acidimicrobiales bacterium]|nr:DNA repair protein RecN [Acidimicrobiales bacterium]